MKRLKPYTVVTFVEGRRVYLDTRTGLVRHRWWTKARVPGTVRKTRMPGGSGFRNNWED